MVNQIGMKRLVLVGIVLSFYFPGIGQDFIDNALLFSRTQPFGSARVQAVGGAQVALGGDYSSALSNPAGLGMYNRSEFTITPGINISNSTSEFYGQKTDDSKTRFSLPGLSLVIHTSSGKETGFLGGSFAISLTRINDFQQSYQYNSFVNNTSIIDYFIQDAGTIDPGEMLIDQNGNMGSYFKSLTGLAYNNYLIDEEVDDNGNVLGYNSILNFSQSRQEEISERSGAQNQWSFAYGANFSDQFFIGVNLGVASLRYKIKQTYREDSFTFEPGYNPIDDFSMEEEFEISGTGINGSLGAIYRPLDFLQVGASYSIPTYYSLRDKYFASMESNWNDPEEEVYEDFREADILEYKLRTPSRIRTGVTFINKSGFITADLEFVNYNSANYKSDSYDFTDSNSDIKSELENVINMAIGAEFRAKSLRYRLGWNLMQDPYVTSGNDANPVDRKVMGYSGGVGYRGSNFFVDLTGVYSTTEGKRYPYLLNNAPSPVAIQDFSSVRVIATVGFTF
jgi:hypothetical protein